MKIALGSKVKDPISGIIGIVIGRSEYLYRSARIQVGIAEVDSNGRPNEPYWFDEAQLEVIEAQNKTALGFKAG